MHLFLSPHLDDVVLSCGATIARLKQQGETVIILTVMAGEPPEAVPDTPVVRALREKFEGVNKAVVTQKAEHAHAAMCLGVQVYHLSLLDSAFRTAPALDGPMSLYPSEDSQRGVVHPADDAKIRLLSTPLPFPGKVTSVYAPLACGNNVDHQLVRDWGLVLGGPNVGPALRFYGDYPDVRNKELLDRAFRYYAQTVPNMRLRPETVFLSDGDLITKISAMRCYASQVNISGESLDGMERSVREWMISEGGGKPAERFWLAIKGTGMLSAPLM
jgi:LmbE family N-acetylglucosaminyl deacetylase